jgi:RNA recognition motif-containing protein
MPPRRAKAAAAKKLTPSKAKKAAAGKPVEQEPEEEPAEAEPTPVEKPEEEEEMPAAAEEDMEAEEAADEDKLVGNGEGEHEEDELEENPDDDEEHEEEFLEGDHAEEVGSEEDEEYEVIDEDTTGEDSSPKKRKPVGEGGTEAKRKKSDAEEEGEPQHQESNMLGVRPLPEEITEEDLKGIFDTSVSVKLSRQSYSDGKRGYVEFKTVEEAREVMESKQGAEFMGKKLELRFVYPPNDARAKMYVGNLPWNGTESDLATIFPTAKSIKIIKNKTDKGLWVPIRYAMLTFTTEEEVKKLAEEKQNEALKGHSLEVMEENKQRLDLGLQEVLRHEVAQRTLVIQGLAPTASKEDLEKIFPDMVQWRIPRKLGSTRNQGVAEVEYANREDVAKLIEEKQGVELLGSSLWLCTRADVIGGFKIGHSNKLTVSGFPNDTDVECLKKAFDGATNAILMSSGGEHHLNSCAIVEFESAEKAKTAFEKKQGMKVRGRSVTLYNWGPIFSKIRRYLQPYDKTNKLLLRDVPKDATEEAIKEKFENCTKAVIITDHKTEEPKGIAYVEFENKDVAETVAKDVTEIELNDTKLPVEIVLKPRENLPLKYFLKNLPDTVTEDSLKEFFTGVEEVEIQGITVKSEKYGIIKFKTADDAREAYKNKDNLEIDGHKFNIEYVKSERSTYRSSGRGRMRSSYSDRGSYRTSRSRGRGSTLSRGRGVSSRGRSSFDSRRGSYDSRGRGGGDRGRGSYDTRGRGYRGSDRGGRSWGGALGGRDYDDYRGREGFRRDRDVYRDKEYREMEDYYKRREEYWRKDDYGAADNYQRRDSYSGRDNYGGYRQDYGRTDNRVGRDDYGNTSREGYWGRDDYGSRDVYDSRRQTYSDNRSAGGFATRGRDDSFRRDKFGGQRRDDYGASTARPNRFTERETYSTRGGGRGSYRGGRGRGGGGFY